MRKIVLASASPRRASLLESVGLEFEVVVSRSEETNHPEMPPTRLVVDNALNKAREVAARVAPESVVIGADTIVYLDGKVLGKPKSMADARRMLSTLSGRTHQVFTGLAVVSRSDDKELTGVEVTDVTFRKLGDSELDDYLRAVSPMDRAGAYTVDGVGSLLVERFEGCFYNVLGLPMVALDRLLGEFSVNLFRSGHHSEKG
jgi:septum formation protein